MPKKEEKNLEDKIKELENNNILIQRRFKFITGVLALACILLSIVCIIINPIPLIVILSVGVIILSLMIFVL